jgi:hypothetical protein
MELIMPCRRERGQAMKKEKAKTDAGYFTEEMIEKDKRMIVHFRTVLKKSKDLKVNIFVLTDTLCDVFDSGKKGKDIEPYFKARLSVNREKRKSTPQSDKKDFERISSFVAGWERDITERRGIYAASNRLTG